MTNMFTSKANVLNFLEKKITKSKIEELYYFTVEDWQKNNELIIKQIKTKFRKKSIIIRSSVMGEDSIKNSQAGNYDSIQDIDSNSSFEIKKNINKVIKSYFIKKNYNAKNEILIQTYTKNIIKSGVVFTRSVPHGSPYYVINYDTGSSTDGVTGGKIDNLIKIFRDISIKKIPTEWKKLIVSIKEIEKIVGSDLLDIEFGIKSDSIIIFQVRPLTTIHKHNFKKIDKKIKAIIIQNKKKFKKLKEMHKEFGTETIFSDMSDWNPAEIIGNNPNCLDYSLYDLLIMKNAWAKGRTQLNYQNLNKYPLMEKFGNKPYVDIRASFNSLIPNIIPKNIKKKLLKFYIKKLKNNPELYDKVEFKILFTCYDLHLKSRFKELEKEGFSKNEIKVINESLIKFTNNVIEKFEFTNKETEQIIDTLTTNRTKIISENKQGLSLQKMQDSIKKLLNDCKNIGTIQFSKMARIAFISSIILKSIDQKQFNFEVDRFMRSISTPLTEIQNDVDKYTKGEITKDIFLQKYGHLRPGTYDITVPRYDKNNKFFTNLQYIKPIQKKSNKKLPKIYTLEKLQFNKIDFLEFVKISLIQREVLKFEFTKNISDSLEIIAKIGLELGFTRNEIAHMDIQTILKTTNKNKEHIIKKWMQKISKEKLKKDFYKFLILPPIITSEKDFEVIKYHITKPNFVTDKKIEGDIVIVNNSTKNFSEIQNKIVIIENADPGYDWIFTKNPLGLITKYGGTASHMAIRCAESGLPAAIGCGEIEYEGLIDALKIKLDCENKQILIQEYNQNHDYIEVRKTLKSLGYIK
jgi:glutamine kinase